MYFNKTQIGTLSNDILNTAIVVFSDYVDGVSHDDYVNDCSPGADLVDSYVDTKNAVHRKMASQNYADLTTKDVDNDMLVLIVNYAFDLSDGDSYGDYRDSTAGGLSASQYNQFRNAISDLYRSTR